MQKAKDITEILKNAAQILAIVIAGIWTYYLFGQKEAPSLEPRADVYSSLSWQNKGEDSTCRAVFNVVFHNTCNTSFDVSKILLRGWLFDKLTENKNGIAFLDIDSIQNSGDNFFNKTYPAINNSKSSSNINPFIIHYPPDASYNHSFEWEIKNMKDKWICFKIEFYINGENDRPKWMAASWDQVCNISIKSDSTN